MMGAWTCFNTWRGLRAEGERQRCFLSVNIGKILKYFLLTNDMVGYNIIFNSEESFYLKSIIRNAKNRKSYQLSANIDNM